MPLHRVCHLWAPCKMGKNNKIPLSEKFRFHKTFKKLWKYFKSLYKFQTFTLIFPKNFAKYLKMDLRNALAVKGFKFTRKQDRYISKSSKNSRPTVQNNRHSSCENFSKPFKKAKIFISMKFFKY